MQLSLTAVTENRKFTKALVRNSEALSGLRSSLTGLDLPNAGIETLQIVFKDRSPDHVRVIGSLDRLTQVEVGIPEDLDQYADGDGFVNLVRSSVLRAISELLVPSDDRELMLARVRGSTSA